MYTLHRNGIPFNYAATQDQGKRRLHMWHINKKGICKGTSKSHSVIILGIQSCLHLVGQWSMEEDGGDWVSHQKICGGACQNGGIGFIIKRGKF